MNQEIIVYRNPMEKAVWDALADGAGIGYIVLGIVAFFSVFVLLNWILGANRYNAAPWRLNVALGAGAVAAALIVFVVPYYM